MTMPSTSIPNTHDPTETRSVADMAQKAKSEEAPLRHVDRLSLWAGDTRTRWRPGACLGPGIDARTSGHVESRIDGFVTKLAACCASLRMTACRTDPEPRDG